MRVAKGGEVVKEEGEVSKREGHGSDIINVGHGGSEEAKAIIARGREKVFSSTGVKLIKEGGEDLVEDKSAREGGKPFRLGEVGPHVVRSDEPACVGSFEDEIKEGEDLGEVGTEN